jgi:hypothetical protein
MRTPEEVPLESKSPIAVAEGLTKALEQTLAKLQNRMTETLPH